MTVRWLPPTGRSWRSGLGTGAASLLKLRPISRIWSMVSKGRRFCRPPNSFTVPLEALRTHPGGYLGKEQPGTRSADDAWFRCWRTGP